jgi:hypothetical protein
MTPLLQSAIEAHGGLERWTNVQTIVVAASITGAIWAVKGQPDYLANIVMRVEYEQATRSDGFPDREQAADVHTGSGHARSASREADPGTR